MKTIKDLPEHSHRLQYGSRHNFQFGPLLNNGLFSSHWLKNRLNLEPEWKELQEPAKACLSQLAALWRVQKTRVALYGDEDTLKRSFIDRLFFRMAGLSDDESAGLEDRLSRML
jgi:hypothetical protein